MLEQLLLPMLLVAGVGAVSIGGCGVVVGSVQILPACNHGQIWAEERSGGWDGMAPAFELRSATAFELLSATLFKDRDQHRLRRPM